MEHPDSSRPQRQSALAYSFSLQLALCLLPTNGCRCLHRECHSSCKKYRLIVRFAKCLRISECVTLHYQCFHWYLKCRDTAWHVAQIMPVYYLLPTAGQRLLRLQRRHEHCLNADLAISDLINYKSKFSHDVFLHWSQWCPRLSKFRKYIY